MVLVDRDRYPRVGFWGSNDGEQTKPSNISDSPSGSIQKCWTTYGVLIRHCECLTEHDAAKWIAEHSQANVLAARYRQGSS